MPLENCHLFRDLSPSRLERIHSLAEEKSVEKGAILYQEGTRAETVFFIKKGAVELWTRVNDRFELPVAIVREGGGCFGSAALVAPYRYNLTAKCVREVLLLTIPTEEIFQLIEEDRELGCIIMANLASHFLARLQETRKELKIHFSTIFRSTQL